MEHWNQIVTAAMMGTDKSLVNASALPAELSEAAALITANTNIGKEEQFLQLGALLMNFRQCGVTALPDPGVNVSKAAAELLPYCSNNAMQRLQDVVAEDMDSLTLLWLQLCTQKKQLIQPAYVPTMLEQATYNKKWQPMVTACCGKRGEWLSQFNNAWNFSANQTADDAWQTGSPEQRKQVLRDQRAVNPSEAIAMLQAVWPQEDANTKQGFLELLYDNISGRDLAFLEPLLAEKSKKVKAEAVQLLLLIPTSGLIRKYEDTLKKLVTVQKEKTLLGMSSKLKLHFAPAESIKKEQAALGLEPKSTEHGYSDEEFIYYQLLRSVQPAFWERYLELPGDKIVELFQSDALGKKLIPALVLAAVANKDKRWGEILFSKSDVLYTDVLPLLPKEKREASMLRFFDSAAQDIMKAAFESDSPWSLPLASKVMIHIANNPYQYPKNMMQKHIRLIPDEVAGYLDSIKVQEEYKMNLWRSTAAYLKQLLNTRKEIINAFNV
ncbi:MAG: DUF5691 domain-containing protein [Pseudobacter sp.]|uniref:DUF5691 domain-containing protein n=1 Tax=Pseudobacter sp. TaxID=2045420 RepID=UPI003F7EA501